MSHPKLRRGERSNSLSLRNKPIYRNLRPLLGGIILNSNYGTPHSSCDKIHDSFTCSLLVLGAFVLAAQRNPLQARVQLHSTCSPTILLHVYCTRQYPSQQLLSMDMTAAVPIKNAHIKNSFLLLVEGG